MNQILAALTLACSLLLSAGVQDDHDGPTQTKASLPSRLSNQDVLDMQAAGLSGDVIAEKIRISTCDFDTAPPALARLKAAGVPDSTILLILRCQPGTTPAILPAAQVTVTTDSGTSAMGEAPKGYVLYYVKSDRKWRLGVRSEPYDKISEYAEDQITSALEQRGFHRLPIAGAGAIRLTIELLEVTSHPAAFKKPGVDASATVTLTDNNERLIYSKGFRGESRTVMNTWGHLIDHAVEDMVKSVVSDEVFIKVLAAGRR